MTCDIMDFPAILETRVQNIGEEKNIMRWRAEYLLCFVLEVHLVLSNTSFQVEYNFFILSQIMDLE